MKKRIISLLLVAMMVFTMMPITATATVYSGYCGDDLIWSFNDSNDVLTISGTGQMDSYQFNSPPWYTFRDWIKKIIIEDGVTSISTQAFHDLHKVSSITIPDSVTRIGAWALYACYGLTSITIPDSVTSIGESAFYACDGLTSITIPDSVTYIGENAFGNCESATTITIPDSINSISNHMFAICTSLTSITIPDSVTSIGDDAFLACTSLTSITIPDSVTSIGYDAFHDCYHLTNVYYGGSKSEWNAMEIDSSNSDLLNATIHFGKSDHTHSYTSKKTEATCESKGYTTYTCKCGDTYKGNYVNALGHKWSDATCTSAKKCSRCGETDGSALGHNYVGGTCSRCGKSSGSSSSGGSSTSTMDVSVSIYLAQDYIEYMYDVNAELGNNDFMITIEDRSPLTMATVSIPYTKGESVIAYDALIAACEEYEIDYTIDPISINNYMGFMASDYICTWVVTVNGVVADATVEIKDGDKLTFSLTSDPNGGTHPLDDSSSSGGGSVETPATSGTCGDNVTWNLEGDVLTISGTGAMYDYAIGHDAPWFDYKDQIKEIIIKGGVTSIGSVAFEACENLTSVTIPDSVTAIGDFAFNNCTSLISVNIPDSVTAIGDWAFMNCTSLTSVTIPDNVTSINASAFSYCTSLTSVTIPDNVTSINTSAFNNCTSLISVNIPDSVTTVGDWAFMECESLTDVYYSGSESDWGIIEMGDGNDDLLAATIHYTTLSSTDEPRETSGECGDDLEWKLSSSGKLTISGEGKMENYDDAEDAPWYEFRESIEEIVIRDGVTSIGENAFADCENVESVTIPASVDKIGDGAFDGCKKLKTVEYDDTASAWKKIDKGDDNAPLDDAELECEEGEGISSTVWIIIGVGAVILVAAALIVVVIVADKKKRKKKAAVAPAEAPVVSPASATWTCPSCGCPDLESKFCIRCGAKKPE